MIRVFISYSNKYDRENAELLYDYLKKEEKIKPILAPKDEETAIENAEKIANEIDICNFFITFYTTKGKQNLWVNQELGYAFNHIRQNRFKIIPIYNNRNDFEGFLTSKSYNFYEGFCLNIEEPEKTMEEVKKYLMEEYKHPIKLEFKIKNNRYEYSATSITLDAIIWIHNYSSKKIQDASLDFVFREYSPDFLAFESNSKFIKTQYESTVLPEFHSNKIIIGNKNINRYNFLLLDILGLNVYEIPLKIRISNQLKTIMFGVYLNIPLFGTTYYQATLQQDNNVWGLSGFHCSDKNSKIIIE